MGRINGLTYNNNELSSINKIIELPAIVNLDGYEFVISKTGETNKLLSDEKKYTGYYADIDTDGKVDGIIFADVVKGSTKGIGEHQWNDQFGKYTIPSSSSTDGFKSYYISKASYKWGDITNPVLSPIETGKDRFYIMSLENFTNEAYTNIEDSSKSYPAYTSYFWYKNAYNNNHP